ncbi:MAG: protein-L-isoaspartate(D-aspartate) O-methyltransferase [Alphaproteobacteria bacterium]|nr:protein-L-isoaspartate(D-aspartate) O-methyltransferase [Alphaproteobacteria bacterium]MBU0802324.1 protein-L-isoaspartate(D-aspartate) O-methyltransferase [Alphaproteobacteria bacterium]MBU0870234.1 protein-L-isoaspartate(D-aspartate) O-methyltransferase [Alphaproteobacteria bacterium]MBU1399823.1 protein-L-isoaspartate(D-aspartate) O-methyltransferase [Alphaproteobacteria bacterium]MBU1590209.1 protein-L-isoaspartate(D-aspartate) O-methyltransferase [Alphaproteobacteria bacterium]
MTLDGREGFAAFLLRLRGKGIVGKELIAAFEATPRGDFVPERWQEAAWAEGMVPIECGEAIEGADLQAQVVHALAIEPGHRVLEIGAGSGYTAAVMARLAARVVTVERFKTLTEQARRRFEALGLTNVFVRQADGAGGLAMEGPFDRIIVWAAYESLPRNFVDQLSSGGIMIAPIGPAEGEQVLTKLTKVGSRFEREEIGIVRLQPIASGIAAAI